MASSVAASGCSFALSGPDPARPRNEVPECDTGKGLVALDGLIGGSFAIASLGLLGAEEGTGAAITGLIAAAFIGSAVRGNTTVNECRQAMTEYAARDVDRAMDEPRVAAGRKAVTPPSRPSQPPSVVQQPGDPYSGDEPPYQAPHVNPVVAPPPAPVVTPPPASRPTTTAKPTPPPPPPQQAEEPQDWKDFWTEVP